MKLRPPGSEQEKSADLDALIIDNGSETLKINTMATTGDREQCFENGRVERPIFATPAYQSGQLRFNLESPDGCRKNFHPYRDQLSPKATSQSFTSICKLSL